MYLQNWAGLIVLGGLMGAMLLVVPLERIRRLTVFGIVFGILFPFLVIGVMQNLLGFWDYRGIDPVAILGIPVFLAVSWFPAVIIFAHLLMEHRLMLMKVLLIVGAGAAVAALHYLMLLNNMVAFENWDLTGSFLLTVGIHLLLAVVLHYTGYLRPEEPVVQGPG